MTLKNPITLRLALGLLTTLVAPLTLVGKQISLDEITLSNPANEKEVRAYLASIANVLDDERARMVNQLRAQGEGQMSVNPALPNAAMAKLAAVPSSYAEMMLKAARDGEPLSRAIMIKSLSARTDYDDAMKGAFLKHLPKFPDLIAVIEAKNWLEGAEAEIVAGWKVAKKDNHGGLLNERSFRYAKIAARFGVTEALVAIAKLTQSAGADRFARSVLGEADEVLKTLVPSELTKAALAEFVVKNEKKLVFDPKTTVYKTSQ